MRARRPRAGMILAAVALWLALTGAALAHGGGQPQLILAPVGPYQITVWTNPEPPAAGVMHFTIALALAASGAAVTDAEIEVLAAPADGAGEVRGRASTAAAATPYFYEADLRLPTPGLWQITVEVAGAGPVSFPLEVQPRPPSLLLPLAATLLLLLLAGLGWLRLRR